MLFVVFARLSVVRKAQRWELPFAVQAPAAETCLWHQTVAWAERNMKDLQERNDDAKDYDLAQFTQV